AGVGNVVRTSFQSDRDTPGWLRPARARVRFLVDILLRRLAPCLGSEIVGAPSSDSPPAQCARRLRPRTGRRTRPRTQNPLPGLAFPPLRLCHWQSPRCPTSTPQPQPGQKPHSIVWETTVRAHAKKTLLSALHASRPDRLRRFRGTSIPTRPLHSDHR